MSASTPFSTVSLSNGPSNGEDPWGEGEENCDAFYYAAHDANYNVIGLFESDGDLLERYEYTPYGERTVYTSAGSNDVTCRSPIMESKRAVADELVIAPVLRPVLTATPQSCPCVNALPCALRLRGGLRFATQSLRS